MSEKNKFAGLDSLTRFLENCKDMFANKIHTHTAEEIGADEKGSASAALVLSKQYTDENLALKSDLEHTHSFEDIIDGQLDEKIIPDSIVRTSDVLSTANQNSLDISYSPTADSDLVTKEYVDYIVPSEEEVLVMLAENGVVDIATDMNGDIFTDMSENVIVS